MVPGMGLSAMSTMNKRKQALIAIISCDMTALEKLTGMPPPAISTEDQDRLALYFVYAYRIAKLKDVREEINCL